MVLANVAPKAKRSGSAAGASGEPAAKPAAATKKAAAAKSKKEAEFLASGKAAAAAALALTLPDRPLTDGQRPIEHDVKLNTAVEDTQSMLAEIETKKLFLVANMIPIGQLHRPPLGTATKPCLRVYEIRAIMEAYVQLLVDRRRNFNSTNVLPGLCIPFDLKTHKLIDKPASIMKEEYLTYDFFVIGGGHSRVCTERLHMENKSNPTFQQMANFIYVGLTAEQGRLLARQHNADQAFSRDMSHNEIIQMMHATYMSHGKSKDWPTKQIALKEIGIPCDNPSDNRAKRWDNSWQLACHDGKIWQLLSQVFKMTLNGTLKGQDKKGKKFLDASAPETNDASALSVNKGKRGRKPQTDRPPGTRLNA